MNAALLYIFKCELCYISQSGLINATGDPIEGIAQTQETILIWRAQQ